MSPTSSARRQRVFPGDSELASRLRALDWSTTALGPPEAWPQTLRTSVSICLTSRVPIVLWPGKPIAQLSFMTLDRPAERPYGHPDLGSHYHGQVEATESRYEGGPGERGQSPTDARVG